jgi:hypothetical protein
VEKLQRETETLRQNLLEAQQEVTLERRARIRLEGTLVDLERTVRGCRRCGR